MSGESKGDGGGGGIPPPASLLRQASAQTPRPQTDGAEEKEFEDFVNGSMRSEITFADGFKWMERMGHRRIMQVLDFGIDNYRRAMEEDGGGAKLLSTTIYARLYQLSYNMSCQTNNLSPQLYAQHGMAIQTYLEGNTVAGRLDRREGDQQALLVQFRKSWQNHKILTEWMRKFYMHLDKSHVGNQKTASLTSVALRKFAGHFDRYKHKLTAAMITLINRQRGGEDIDEDILRETITCYEMMGAARAMGQIKKLVLRKGVWTISDSEYVPDLVNYKDDYESEVLRATHEYYATNAQYMLHNTGTPAYLRRVEQILDEERRRCTKYMIPSQTMHPLITHCQRALLVGCYDAFMHAGTGAMQMMMDKRNEDLERMFRLHVGVEGNDSISKGGVGADDKTCGLQPFADIYKGYIERLGLEIISDREARLGEEKAKENPRKNPEFVQSLVDLHTMASEMTETVFHGHLIFQKAMKQAFERVMNTEVDIQVGGEDGDTHPNSEMMAGYCDFTYKESSKMSREDLELKLDKIVDLFAYLKDKDMFGVLYRDMMGARLLDTKDQLPKDEQLADEKVMISKLKVAAGNSFTSKHEGMLNDLQKWKAMAAKEWIDLWKTVHAKGDDECDRGPVEFLAKVLTGGFWPSRYREMPRVTPPPPMAVAVQWFTQMYTKKNSTHRLGWIYESGSCHIDFKPPGAKKKKTLMCSTIQGMVLHISVYIQSMFSVKFSPH